jgi:hypothetical protein
MQADDYADFDYGEEDDDFDYRNYTLNIDNESIDENMPKNQIALLKMIDAMLDSETTSEPCPKGARLGLISQAVSNLRDKGKSSISLSHIDTEIEMMLNSRIVEKMYLEGAIELVWDVDGESFWQQPTDFNGGWKYIKEQN